VGYWEGLLGGFTGRKREYEQEQIRQQDLANTRESKIYEALINSPDPEVKAAAITGLLTSAQKPTRAGGLRGWLGEMHSNPAMERIKGLVGTMMPEEETVAGPPTLSTRAISGSLPTPAGGSEGSLAQPSTSAVTGGPMATPEPAAEPGPISYAGATAPAPAAAPISPAVGQPPAQGLTSTPSPGKPTASTTRTVMHPRQIFQSPEEVTLQRYSAQEKGEILGVVSAYEAVGVPHAEAVQRAIEERQHARGMGGMGAGFQSIAGQMPDGSTKFASYDRRLGKYIDPQSGQPLEGFQPRTTVGSTSMGADREAIARASFGKPYAQLTQPQQQQVLVQETARAGEKAGTVTTARGEAAADIPLSTQQRFQATTDLSKQWTAINGPFREMQRQAQLMQTGLQRVDADPIGGSQAVLVTFQKVLDPSSVVRESEYARSPAGLAIMDRLQGMYEKYSAGGAGVPKPILAEMVETAQQFLQGMQGWNEQHRSRIQRTAESYGIDPSLVLGVDTQGGVAAGGGPSPAVATPPPGAPPKAAGGLDTTVPGVYVDAQGNLIIRR
jgi:hypothetical protein